MKTLEQLQNDYDKACAAYEKARYGTQAAAKAGQWRVIVQGIPLTADKATPAAAKAAAERLGAVIAPVAWNADRQQWVHTHTIEELTA